MNPIQVTATRFQPAPAPTLPPAIRVEMPLQVAELVLVLRNRVGGGGSVAALFDELCRALREAGVSDPSTFNDHTGDRKWLGRTISGSLYV